MQVPDTRTSTASRNVGSGRRGNAARIRSHAATSLAKRREHAPWTFDGALPTIQSGAIAQLLERESPLATPELALALHDAGLESKKPLPRDLSPLTWIVGALDALALRYVPRRTFVKLYLSIHETSDQRLAIALDLAPQETPAVPLQPLLDVLGSQPAQRAACWIINNTLMVMGPDRLFYAVSYSNWQGEDDEESIKAEYAAGGETYEGITRAQWDAVYPEWTRSSTKSQLAAGMRALRAVAEVGTQPADEADAARSQHRARAARALLGLKEASALPKDRSLFLDAADALRADSHDPWGIPMIGSREENVSALVLDQMYEMLMQSSTDSSLYLLQFPQPEIKSARKFVRTLQALLREFAAASELCQIITTLEKSCTRSSTT